MRIVTNLDRARNILGPLLEKLYKGVYPFDNFEKQLPHSSQNLPKTLELGGIAHSLYLLILSFGMRGGVQSDVATKSFANLYDCWEYQSLFIPRQAKDLSATWISFLLQIFGFRYKSREIGTLWVHNMRKIDRHWKGNPLILLDKISTYEEALRRIQNRKKSEDEPNGLLGFQEKMTSLLLYFLMDEKLIPRFLFPLPTDFHNCRFFLSTGMIKVQGVTKDFDYYHSDVRQALRDFFVEYCLKYGDDYIRLMDVTWVYSRSMCRYHPGNQSKTIGERTGRKTQVVPIEVIWDRKQMRQFEKSCGVCSIEKECKHTFAAAKYYIQGKLLRSPRSDPPYRQMLLS